MLKSLGILILTATLATPARGVVGRVQNHSSDRPRGENIALGRPYELLPSPNWSLTNDPGDDVQLTDGKYTEGRFWTQKSTVGWWYYTPQITIDLGKVEPIAGIMIDCPGGGEAGVRFPREVAYLVSDDGENFYQVACLTSEGLAQDGSTSYTHHFLAPGLKTRGRYVMVRPRMGCTLFFTDEIEVYKGDFDPSSVRFAGRPQSGRQMAFGQFAVTPETYTRGHFPPTPHVKWAIPLAGGSIPSIVISDGGCMRDVAEIAQRVDLDYVPIFHSASYAGKTLTKLMQTQLGSHLANARVLIVGGYRWEATPPVLLEGIKSRVREGMGLVWVTSDPAAGKLLGDLFTEHPLAGEQGILDVVPVSRIPAYHSPGTSHFHLATYGKGRVAWFNPSSFCRAARSLVPNFTLADLDDDANCPVEYYHEALGKLILWAARRDQRRIAAVRATAENVSVAVAAGSDDTRLEFVVRDEFFDPVLTRQMSVPAAGGKFDLRPPAGRNGTQYVDVWLKDGRGGVLDFGSAAWQVSHPVRITAWAVDEPFYAVGQPVVVNVQVQGPLTGLRLQARLLDTNGREITVPADAAPGADGKASFRLRPDHPLTLAGKLYVCLLRGNAVLEKRFAKVWFDLPEKDDYQFCAWYAWVSQPNAYYGLKMLRDLGIDTYVSSADKSQAENGAWVDLRLGPENVSRVHPENKDSSRVRVPCLTDPAYRAVTARKVEGLAAGLRPYGVLEWSMGDESVLGYGQEFCTSPSCLAGFRQYLKDGYKTLDALNASWGSRYTAWQDVVPATMKDVAKKAELGAWLDHRRYMESVFADYHAWCRQLVARHIPTARVGISGTPPELTSYSGYDWWKLLQGQGPGREPLTHLSAYGGTQNALQRSFMAPGAFRTGFLGYDWRDDNEQVARYGPWSLLFGGANGINYYTLVADSMNSPLILSDMSLTKKAGWFFEEICELKGGLGRLFMAATYENDGIAIHYSPASVHVATAAGLTDARNSLRNYNINLSNLCTILKELRYQHDFVHEQQMARGDLARYKVLILPWSSAVSPAEAAAIRTFVEHGGTVIADSYCGVRDDHGKTRPMLDDLFGIRQPAAPPELARQTLTLTGAAAKALAVSASVPVASGTQALKLAGGTAQAHIGTSPALVCRSVGKGRAIFLNASFSNYAQVRSGGAGGEVLEQTQAPPSVTMPIRALVGGLLAQAGVAVPLPVAVDKNQVMDVELARFSVGRGRLVGMVRSITEGTIDYNDRLSCTADLRRPTHVYDTRVGRYVGEVSQIKDALPRGIARVYSLLPYKVDRVLIESSGTVNPGQALPLTIRVVPQGADADTHVVHLSVQGPDGKERAWYAANLVASGGKAQAMVPFAYNDPPGAWTVTVRDVASGEKACAIVTLKK